MPFIVEMETHERKVGMICDCCGKEDHNLCSDFELKHTFGYGSPIDMDRVTAAICDSCLLKIILQMVPGAIFRGQNDEAIPHDKIARMLRDFEARMTASTRQPASDKS